MYTIQVSTRTRYLDVKIEESEKAGMQAEHALVAQARSVIGSTPSAYQPFLFLLHNV